TVSADAVAKRAPGGPNAERAPLPCTPVRVYDALTLKELAALGGEHESVRSALFSPDGTRVLTVADNLHNTVIVDPNGKVTGTGSGGSDSDRTARIWDARTAKPLHVLASECKEIYSAVWDASGQRIATVDDNSTARIWDAQTGRELQVLTDRT